MHYFGVIRQISIIATFVIVVGVISDYLRQHARELLSANDSSQIRQLQIPESLENFKVPDVQEFIQRPEPDSRPSPKPKVEKSSYDGKNYEKTYEDIEEQWHQPPPLLPVYFISHGSPDLIEDTDHAAYHKLQEIGVEITRKVKPRAIVVLSAHWQSTKSNTVEVNTAEITDLIYDFYGFPAHYYDATFPHTGSTTVAREVIAVLRQAKITVQPTTRGLDHGVWVPFSAAFASKENLLNIPIVQVSLFKTEDLALHYRLGLALSSLRSEGILIIGSGMAVHNLRDMRYTVDSSAPLPYTVSFDEALKSAVTADPDDRQRRMVALMKRPDARQAHPTFEHLLPLFVAAGAAGDDSGRRLSTLLEGSMSWAMFRFGEVPNGPAVGAGRVRSGY